MLLCFSVVLPYLAFLSISWMIKVMYILGLVLGILAGLITTAFSFMIILSSPVYQVVMLWLRCFGCFVLICMCDLSPAS